MNEELQYFKNGSKCASPDQVSIKGDIDLNRGSGSFLRLMWKEECYSDIKQKVFKLNNDSST